MPVVTVHLWPGRTLEQKRDLVSAITKAMVEHGGARPDALHVILHEVAPENWGLAGILGPDRTDVEPSAGPKAAPRILHVAQRVADLERSERFYRGLLGFLVRERTSFRDGSPLVSFAAGLGVIGSGTSATDHIAFEVGDLESMEAGLRAAGADIVRGPLSSAYGRSLYVRDPDGVEIELVQTTKGGL